jgi:hypothetical protein
VQFDQDYGVAYKNKSDGVIIHFYFIVGACDWSSPLFNSLHRLRVTADYLRGSQSVCSPFLKYQEAS